MFANYSAEAIKIAMSSGALPRVPFPEDCKLKKYCEKEVEAFLYLDESARPGIETIRGRVCRWPVVEALFASSPSVSRVFAAGSMSLEEGSRAQGTSFEGLSERSTLTSTPNLPTQQD